MLVNNNNVEKILEKFNNQSIFVVDIETNGLDILEGSRLCGIGVGISDGSIYYFPFRQKEGNIDLQFLPYLIKCLEKSIIVGHNIKFDIKGLFNEGFDYSECTLIDTIVIARLCSYDRNPKLSLKALSDRYFGEGSSSYANDLKVYMRKNKLKLFSEVPANIISEYCDKDIEYTFKLYKELNKEIKKSGQLDIWIKEINLTKVFLDIEIRGIKVDIDYCKKCANLLDKKYSTLEKEIFRLANEEFNIDSPQQLSKVMNKMNIKSAVKTEKGADSWSQQAMVQLDFPICKSITEYRTIGNLKHTFFDSIANKKSNIVHPSFKNWGTVTGRLSCEEPNLQNIPRFTKDMNDDNLNEEELSEASKSKKEFINRMVQSGGGGSSLSSWAVTGDEYYGDDSNIISARRLFIPREGYELFAIDYVQMEVVVFLYYLKEFGLMNKIANHSFDFHDYIAISAFKADKEDKNTFKFFRQIAKGITFGIIYGMGDKSLSVQIGKSLSEAREFKENYFRIMPKAKSFINKMNNLVRKGYTIYSDLGRRYCIPPEKAYLIINYLIQGTAGDITKEVMINLNKFLNNKKSAMLIQIHDEILFEIHNSETNIIPEICKIMSINSLDVPLAVDIKRCIGSWGSKEDYVL